MVIRFSAVTPRSIYPKPDGAYVGYSDWVKSEKVRAVLAAENRVLKAESGKPPAEIAKSMMTIMLRDQPNLLVEHQLIYARHFECSIENRRMQTTLSDVPTWVPIGERLPTKPGCYLAAAIPGNDFELTPDVPIPVEFDVFTDERAGHFTYSNEWTESNVIFDQAMSHWMEVQMPSAPPAASTTGEG